MHFIIIMFVCMFPVTIARAIELKHNSTLISALAYETVQLYTTAGIYSHTFNIFYDHVTNLYEIKYIPYCRYLVLSSCSREK